MSTLLDIQTRLSETNVLVSDLEAALCAHPDRLSIAANLRSAVKLQSLLQSQFMEAAAQVGIEVCRYRAFTDIAHMAAAPAFSAIASFQRLFSVVFGSLKYGFKQRAVISSEVATETGLQFRFAFTGSVGVVLTARSDANLFDDSFLDDSLETVFKMAKAKTPKQILAFADKLGPGAINALHRWARDNADGGLGADIEWRRGTKVRGKLFVQRQELSKLRAAIDLASSPKEETATIEGVLDAASVSKRKFKIKREGLPDIGGSVEPGAIDRTHTATLPMRYRARVRKTTTLKVASGKLIIKWHLLGLTRIKGAPK